MTDPRPPRRTGPRPLPLHINTLILTWLTSRGGLSGLNSGSLPWRPDLAAEAANLRSRLSGIDPALFALAVDAEARRWMQGFVDGVRAYRDHPYRRDMDEPPCLRQIGAARLLDHGYGRPGPVVVVVPSLVNRAYILDLMPDRSLLRYLAERGLRPLLIDWGVPGDAERRFGLDDYIAGTLEALLDVAIRESAGKVALAGYCMGGLLALPAALWHPDRVAGLALLATPWDFHRGQAAQRHYLKAALPQIEALALTLGELPVDALQTLFAGIDPWGIPAKFTAFARLDPATRRARRFVALEDWLNDGVPLVPEVTRQCLREWYLDNRTGRGDWRIDGRPVRPEEVTAPTLAMVPRNDRIVPPDGARALGEAIPGARVRTVPAGHIGMTAGARAATVLYRPLSDWLHRVLAR